MQSHYDHQHKQVTARFLERGGLFLKHNQKPIFPYYLNWESALEDYGKAELVRDKNIGTDYGKNCRGLNDASLCQIIQGLDEQDCLYATPTPTPAPSLSASNDVE